MMIPYLINLVEQWVVMFYLTYYVCGWDVTEPISYLISLGLEVVGIYYFLRYSRGFEQRSIFQRALNKYKPQLFWKKSAHPDCELTFLNHRINYLNQKLLYAKSL